MQRPRRADRRRCCLGRTRTTTRAAAGVGPARALPRELRQGVVGRCDDAPRRAAPLPWRRVPAMGPSRPRTGSGARSRARTGLPAARCSTACSRAMVAASSRVLMPGSARCRRHPQVVVEPQVRDVLLPQLDQQRDAGRGRTRNPTRTAVAELAGVVDQHGRGRRGVLVTVDHHPPPSAFSGSRRGIDAGESREQRVKVQRRAEVEVMEVVDVLQRVAEPCQERPKGRPHRGRDVRGRVVPDAPAGVGHSEEPQEVRLGRGSHCSVVCRGSGRHPLGRVRRWTRLTRPTPSPARDAVTRSFEG